MVPTLIVLGLLALGVGIVVYATRLPATRQDVIVDQDTAWADPSTTSIELRPHDPFAHAPLPTSVHTEPKHQERA